MSDASCFTISLAQKTPEYISRGLGRSPEGNAGLRPYELIPSKDHEFDPV